MTFGRLMRIAGQSMLPTLRPGDLVFVRRVPAAALRPGDLVAARPASLGGRALVKRLVGLPAEHVRVNDQRWELTADQYFLLGDRPGDSTDSRSFGPVRPDEIVGRVDFRLWPWTRFRPQP